MSDEELMVCPICGRAVADEDTYCSEECNRQWQRPDERPADRPGVSPLPFDYEREE